MRNKNFRHERLSSPEIAPGDPRRRSSLNLYNEAKRSNSGLSLIEAERVADGFRDEYGAKFVDLVAREYAVKSLGG